MMVGHYEHLVQGPTAKQSRRLWWTSGVLKQAIDQKKEIIVLEEINRNPFFTSSWWGILIDRTEVSGREEFNFAFVMVLVFLFQATNNDDYEYYR